jgi:hypothetical protein
MQFYVFLSSCPCLVTAGNLRIIIKRTWVPIHNVLTNWQITTMIAEMRTMLPDATPVCILRTFSSAKHEECEDFQQGSNISCR